MSIDEMKAAAWKKYQSDSNGKNNNCRDVFEIGYLAGLRDLYTEVHPYDMKLGSVYLIESKLAMCQSLSMNTSDPTQKVRAWVQYFGTDRPVLIDPEDKLAILKIPSLAEITGLKESPK